MAYFRSILSVEEDEQCATENGVISDELKGMKELDL